MVSYADVSVTDPTAQRMLAAYFAERAAGFPPQLGAYRTAFPDPEVFIPPAGVFIIAHDEDDNPAGCGGVRSLPTGKRPDGGGTDQEGLAQEGLAQEGLAQEGLAQEGHRQTVRYEIKHLWVDPAYRGLGLGRSILSELEDRARGFGATEVVLDTNFSLEAAGALYRSSGYEAIEPYNDNPNATDWYRKVL
ncbi:GNAT family N-acetyltransferase [Diaminobutyricibacter sp. McL0618]|uniref:GNAT family N-acetyltransferase n=1 Tax=Leifsonia sp. McL0618 TaxID=3415677 RepID=UPI003CFA3CD0